MIPVKNSQVAFILVMLQGQYSCDSHLIALRQSPLLSTYTFLFIFFCKNLYLKNKLAFNSKQIQVVEEYNEKDEHQENIRTGFVNRNHSTLGFRGWGGTVEPLVV